jgi:transcription initiation factor TFIIIB Brf1 subunit/transcription initiation factor TFIIB
MSDGNLVKNFKASQHLCKACGCVFTEYEPADRLRRYFAEEYDVSDVVQNCQVVIEDTKFEKHSVIHENILNECKALATAGAMLEIACGEGDLSRKFARRFAGWQCLGIDPSANANLDSSLSNLQFVRNFFGLEEIGHRKFDVIIAHGILNRTPTLKMLTEIAESANDGALVSLEIVTLENSYYAPYIWDHSYTYLEQTFVSYLDYLGFKVYKNFDCGSTVQFVARFDLQTYKNRSKLQASAKTVESTLALYQHHLEKWKTIVHEYTEHSKRAQGQVALFGAGLYSAVLYHLVDSSKISLIIDEYRAGTQFDGRRVVSLDEVKSAVKEIHVLLCCRERNVNFIVSKLKTLSIKVSSLITSN